jgi:hypothetical protein
LKGKKKKIGIARPFLLKGKGTMLLQPLQTNRKRKSDGEKVE